ncbi:MAG: GNAT family N-acetyltransferase [Bacteroidota bacterium]
MQIDAAPTSSGRPDFPGVRVERVGMDRYAEVQALNRDVFGDDRVIFRLDRRDLTFLLAFVEGEPVGFKVGYGESESVFYSAKGGVLELFRRKGIAKLLLDHLMAEAREMGYRRFAYDTFPNKHPGMTVMGLAEGFRVTAAGYNAAYRDYRIRFEARL